MPPCPPPAPPVPPSPPPEEGPVAVLVRVRPPNPCERGGPGPPLLHLLDQHVLVFNPEEPGGPPGSLRPPRGPQPRGKAMKFVFDRVFGEGATQEEVFQHSTRGLLDSVLGGYNCSVFAYGATGAGKTYTMLGSEQSPGIMYLSMVELYKRLEARKGEKSCQVLVSYQEVYNEEIHDLLEPKGPLAIREDPEKGVVVQGLSLHQPSSAEQLLEMLASGNKNRTQHPTDANATSSRSHAIFQVYVKQQDLAGGLAQDLQVGKLSLVDLAGSERAAVANTKGERLREGANINRSLLALINVINALADAKSKKTHIPYRDSKLTRLLKDSIGGNCRTVVIAAVSPSGLAHHDTYNTLKYASRAKEIKQSLKSKELSSDCPRCQHAVCCQQLQAEVAELRAKLRAHQEAEKRAPALPPALTCSPGGLPRLEAPVPRPCSSGLADAREGDGEQLEAGWPVGPQLGAEEQPQHPSHLLQGLSCCQMETLLGALLSVVQKQSSLLRAANLLSPAMACQVEQLERRVRQEAAGRLEPTGVSASPPGGVSASVPVGPSGASPGRRMQPGCEGEGWGQRVLSPPLGLGVREELGVGAELRFSRGAPRRGDWGRGTAGAPSSPWQGERPCPLPEPRGSPAPAAAQPGCTAPDLPPRALPRSPASCRGDGSPPPAAPCPPPGPGWEKSRSLPDEQDSPVLPSSWIPLAARGGDSSIPKPTPSSRVPVLKRRRVQR
ncbi:LOW QUALITY PROTEIN: kinesin-like protein KIF18B [Apus apus]|uniref:LOW QUALITY PROTEIN: kinesin-like protein KIF18B n=1 Tax=Apus apus TaxID=8895 RepID=UPI0021F83CB9|nr:LOW QUALITY PROTEIN: kinesin-like protein KIF18B [Apus apus]